GWKVWTVGDDICWMHLGRDGELRAINPEAGYFGVVPGTNAKTNPNAFAMIQRDTIFTNVALTEDKQPWWEGLEAHAPAIDWQGRPYSSERGPAAHPNARFTVAAKNNPVYSDMAEAPEGVPISAILFGGRRREVAPLVYEARNWAHGVLLGAGMASETTAAATGAVGVVRRDSMAMKPFCGYNFGDYWNHWLSLQTRSTRLPRIIHVNGFRQGPDGKFLWPGFGDNLRVLQWIIERCQDRDRARATAIGFVTRSQDLDLHGIELEGASLDALLSIDPSSWRRELEAVGRYLDEFEERVPEQLRDEHRGVLASLEESASR